MTKRNNSQRYQRRSPTNSLALSVAFLLPAAWFIPANQDSTLIANGGRLPVNRALPSAVPSIDITPNPAMVDEPVIIKLSGFIPGQAVMLRAEMRDGAGNLWSSWARFISDGRGAVDVRSKMPRAGTYADINPMGLFWSAALESGTEPVLFEKSLDKSMTVHLTALVDERPAVSADLAWIFLAPGASVSDVRERGLVGKFFRPREAGARPGLLVVGGSGGGLNWSEEMAAMFCSHGFAALALAYFGIDPLPKALDRIPLEYFETALDWMRQQPAVAKDAIGAVGISRGGELVLLLGSTFPSIKAVVSYSPSAFLWMGLGMNMSAPPHSAWSYRGQDLPFLIPFGLGDAYLQAVQSSPPSRLDEAAIPVERIKGPVLLVSGQDDKIWSGSTFAEMVKKRLTENHHPYPDGNLSYPGAGHYIRFPFIPTTVHRRRHPVFQIIMEFGGNAAGDEAAAADSWPKVVEFLEKNLGRKISD